MKKFIFFLLLMISVSGFSQNFSDDIRNQFLDYNQLMINKEFEKALDRYANEDFLQLVPRDQMLDTMDLVFNSKEMEFKTYPPENIIVEDNILKSGNKTYLKLNYNQRIDMKFLSNEIPKEQLLAALQREFGSGKVKFNDQTQFYEIHTQKEAVASSSNLKSWKFTVLEKNQFSLLSRFLPRELLSNMN